MQAQMLGTVPLRPETNNDGFPNRRGGRIFLFRQRKCAATRPSGMLRAVISDTNRPVRVFVCLSFSVTPLPIRCFASTIFVGPSPSFSSLGSPNGNDQAFVFPFISPSAV